MQYVLSCFSYVWLFAPLWTIARQSALSMGFSRQEDWPGLPWPPPGDLPDPGIKPPSLMLPALAAGSLPLVPPGKYNVNIILYAPGNQNIHVTCFIDTLTFLQWWSGTEHIISLKYACMSWSYGAYSGNTELI